LTRPFRVVTHRRWLAEQFPNAIHDWGLDINPETAMDTIWWSPGAWVARAYAAGIQLPLTSCGPRWLSDCPKDYTGRWVDTGPLSDWINPDALAFVSGDSDVFVKLPEAKLDNFPARVHVFNRHWATTLGQYHLPEDTLIQMQNVVKFIHEARYWVAHGEITASSMYRIGDTIWGDPGWESAQADCLWSREEMDVFASRVVHNVEQPPGWVLDIGMTEDGPLVVEANAAWSSGPYDGDPQGIFKAIEASHDFDHQHPRWAWNPNPVFGKVHPLKLSQPVIS